MLKRYQVLLEDWQEDYLIFLSKKYDLSFSEVIRGVICLQAMHMTQQLYPEFKTKFSPRYIQENMEKHTKSDRQRFHRFISEAFFESRKAIEYRLRKENKNKKTKKT